MMGQVSAASTILVNVDPQRLRSYHLSLDDVVGALNAGNVIIPSGNVRIHDRMPMVPVNAMVRDFHELGNIPIKPGESLYLRDLARISDGADTATGYALINGKRTIFLMVTKRADASTLAVINSVKDNLGRMQDALPPDVPATQELIVADDVVDTLADTLFCRLALVRVAERLPGGPPPRLHDPRLLVAPDRLARALRGCGLELTIVGGLRPSVPGYVRWLLRRADTVRMVATRSTAGVYQAVGRKPEQRKESG